MKNPFIIIAVLFLLAFFLVNKYSVQELSDEPVILNKANPPSIVMFSTTYCKYCALARAFFDKHNLPYVEHDIDRSDKHREMFYLMGGKGTPLLIVNDSLIHGFEEKYIRDAL